MSCLAVNMNYIAVAKALHVDIYDHSEHRLITVPTKSQETDFISDIILSESCKYLGLITSSSKQLLLYDLPLTGNHKTFTLPRSASKIRFTINDEQILVADKSGDVLIYSMKDGDTGTKILGHLSLLLDVLQTDDSRYIISSDRDEKIRVSCYPNTYNIQTYCLGHKEFVNHIELLPHDPTILTSTSGDGHVNFWNYVFGKLCYNIDTFQDVDDANLKQEFIKAMDSEIVQVDTLPIVHYAAAKLDDNSSLLALTIYSYNKLLLYRLIKENDEFSHHIIKKIDLDIFPSAIACHKASLHVFDGTENTVTIFELNKSEDSVNVTLHKKVKVFENITLETEYKESFHESIKVLYKRKFDNVQEYQERKKQRLEKLNK